MSQDEGRPTKNIQKIDLPDIIEEEAIMEQEDQSSIISDQELQELIEWINPRVENQLEMKEDQAKMEEDQANVTEEEQKQIPKKEKSEFQKEKNQKKKAVAQGTQEQTINQEKSELITLSQELQEERVELAQETQEQTMDQEKSDLITLLSQELQEERVELGTQNMTEEEQGQVSLQECCNNMQEIPNLATMAQAALETRDKGEKKEKQNSTETETYCVPNNISVVLSTIPVHDESHESYCRTEINSTVFCYTWEIDRFSSICQVIKQLNSIFPPLFELSLKINNIFHSEGMKSNLTLQLLSTIKFDGICSVSLSNDTTNITKNSVSGYITNNTVLCNYTATSERCNKLIIECKVEVFHQVKNTGIHNLPLSSRYYKALNNNLNLDSIDLNNKSIHFIVNGERYTIPVNLLESLDSSYFRKVCDKYKQDNSSNKIVINENPIAFKQMVLYIKTRSFLKTHTFDMVQNLLMLAHKFDVLSLKELCERHLKCYIQKSNAIQLIKLAILCNAKYLEECTANFIKFYQTDIINRQEFQLLPRKVSNKIIELINKIQMNEDIKYVKDINM